MNLLFIVFLLCCQNLAPGKGTTENFFARTLHGTEDPPPLGRRTLVLNADVTQNSVPEEHRLHKRAAPALANNDTIIQKMNYLNDSHKQLMVHWVGEGSNVIICLAKDPTPATGPVSLLPVGPSAVYISYNYGDTYENKTEQFKMPNGSYAVLDKFYNHPKYNTHFVFADIRYNMLYVTSNHGRDIKQIQLNFTPSDVSFHELQPAVFVVLDKTDPKHTLWITEDFGENFRPAQDFVKAFYWVKKDNEEHKLVVQRMEPNGLSSVIYSSTNLYTSRVSTVYSSDSKDFFIKGDYLFTTKTNSDGVLELYVSYKLGQLVKCEFDTRLEKKAYYIVDVTNNRALVAVSHTDTGSHLYVSENLEKGNRTVKFTLSLEDVLCYFPNSTWQATWLHHVSEEAFADVYKVEGLAGIYIASRVLVKPLGINLGPQHLGSVITFDHGRSWRLIRAPIVDVEYQQTACSVDNNCSLHLSQKFSQLYPDTRSISILSSKSAPGIIIATGVLGKSLKGHYGVYVSTDAGLTWRQTLRDLYFFNMGDHGGIFTAVKYFKLRGETRHVLYSTDEGETWKQSEFHNEDIRLYGLMTEPGENTTVFTMFGSLPQEHQWIIVKLDLIKAFKYNCSKDDYKPWSPGQSDENRSYIPCVLGQQLTFQRRLPHANCYNGQDFDAPISMRPCECDIYDYECDWRFVRSKDPGHCIPDPSLDFDPYKVPDECQPGNLYLRWKGYRRIPGDKCVDGFRNLYEPEHVPCPFNEVQDFLLFAQRERISRYNLVTKAVDELPVKKLKNVIAIDFDMKNNCVYWADIALDTIGRQCLSNGSEPEILVSSDLASIEGMALDWISNTLYFVDGMRSKIELIRTDINHSGRMRRTILGPDVLKKPRGIALHPKAGYMFWTDWSAENPSVNRANLDGSNILKLFGKPRVEWPNGITIDYVAERIYWVDARQDYIASSDLHGDFFKMIVAHEEVVSHPFAVAVFKNNMYWDDWKRNAIFSADKNQFRGVEVLLKQLPGLMDLKVYSHGIQIGTNACANTTWPYVCVGLPKTGARSALLCPDGMTKQNGKCLCPGNVEPYANSTCPKIDNSCSPEHFACGNGFCVPKGWRCDGEDDCGDNSDERQCGTQTCPPSHFVCGDGKCVPQYWRCDYDSDCPDGSDEMNCPKQNCTEDQFTCNNGRCVSLKWRCDRENDCRDGSDELNCTPMEPTACKKDEFQCKSGALTCIPPTWRCDGERDCRDGSDEADCTNNTCLNVQFSCGPPTNRCIYLTWVCDGTNDCPDGRDEKNCTTPPPPPPVVPPTDNDNTDQFVQKNGTCQEWMFKCMNTKCIPYWWKCDGSDDCGDDSDEMGCHTVEPITFRPQTTLTPPSRAPPKQCQSNQFQCLIGGDCIFASWVCDGMEDCEAGEDELNCFHTINCTSAQFRCRMDGSCIPSSAVCDQHFDCPDGTDELECEHNLPNAPATPSCNVGYFPCDSNSCYPLAAMCDGKSDCRDGYDEANCTKARRVYQVLQMGVDERGINESTLLLYWWIPTPTNVTLEFMPTISKVDEEDPSHSVWHNQSWTENSDYLFTDLEPYTKYNMTIYVRVRGSNTVFPPAKYFIAYTGEGIPTEPWNVTAKQRNGSHVLITWNKPVRPNGVIAYYQICWYPPLPPIKLKLSGNETAHLLAADFQPDVNYSFYVIAHNRKFESRSSEPTTIKFDGDSGMDRVRNLTVLNRTDTSLVLGWKYNKTADGFTVYTLTDRPYPKLPPLTTKDTNITIDKLAPGAHYRFRVNAFKKTFVGPETTIGLFTDGLQLPEVSSLQGMAIKNIGTAVKLSWERPKDSRKVNWVYGVYYGIDEDELFERPRLQTTNLTAIVTNLQACEIYTFTIGLVGPLGYGPLSKKSVEINTSLNKKAPPKKLTVTEDKSNSLKIKVQWQPSCPSEPGSVSYVIRAHERTRNKVWYVKKDNSTNLTHVFNVTYGAVYDISVATTDPEAIYTPNVTYFAPPILPPAHVKTFVENNGSFVVYWNERDMPKDVGRFKYEVLVSRGNELNESTAEKFVVDQPPFIYSNTTFDMYTFAVRVKAESGFMSPVSEKISATTSYYQESQSIPETSLSLILSLTVVGLIVAALVVVVLFVKHRRLQNSFTRFANSHYNTRSGAATFDDHSLEEEDNSPQITGFSDDEPLVIA